MEICLNDLINKKMKQINQNNYQKECEQRSMIRHLYQNKKKPKKYKIQKKILNNIQNKFQKNK